MSNLYTDASLIMYPSGYKEDKIYSLKPTDGSGDLTFTRASTATRVNAEGLIETSPVNLVTYSEEFENAAWTKNELTITANNATSPNGIQNADTALETTTNAYHDILNTSTSLTLNTNYTLSCFVKYAGREYIYLFISDGIAAAAVKFNVQTGVVLGTALGTVVSSKIENFGNGWYRCSMVYTASVSVTGTIAISTTNSPALSLATYAGDVTKGISVWGAQLNIGTTAKPYFPTTDRLNVPRIDYTGGGCGKLLLEPQRSNLMLQSENLNLSWIPIRAIATSNAATSPDGTASADKIIADTETNTTHLFFQNKTSLAAGTYTYSAFFKKSEYEFGAVRIATDSDTKRFAAVVNLNTGAITATDSFGSPTGTSSNVQDYGNGWYRLIVTCTHTSGDILGVTTLSPTAVPTFENSLPRFTGDNTSGVFTWGASLEAGSYVSSYIPTLASSVTRLAESQVQGGFSSLIGQSQGVLFLDIENSENDTEIFSLNRSITNSIFVYASSGFYIARGWSDGTAFTVTTTIPNENKIKIAIAYKNNDFAIYANGVQLYTSSLTWTPLISIDTMNFNIGGYVSSIGKALYSQVILFPTRLTNTQLATLTTI